MNTLVKTSCVPSHSHTFERAREAVITLTSLKPTLTSAELETLSLLMDSQAMQTIEQSMGEAARGEYEPFTQAVRME